MVMLQTAKVALLLVSALWLLICGAMVEADRLRNPQKVNALLILAGLVLLVIGAYL